MQKLQASNYSSVSVLLKNGDRITMPASGGLTLMDYLASENAASHVQLTSKSGDVILVNKFEIVKVSPVSKSGGVNYKTATELGMPEL